MALDATGTPTAILAIPKYNTAVDPPSGKGFNAAVDVIDGLINAHTGVNAAGTTVLGNKLLTADANPAFKLLGDGDLKWGAGGASAVDVGLSRTAADQLEMDAGDTLKLSAAGLKFSDDTTITTAPGAGDTFPPGMTVPYAGSAAPSGWLLADGTSYATATYADLFAAIGYTYGGSGANFNVPSCKGRIPVGRDAAQTEFDVLGETGGVKTHALSIAELPSHDHGAGVHSHGVTDPGHFHYPSTDAGNERFITKYNGGGTDPQAGSGSVWDMVGSLTTGTSATGISINNSAATISAQGSGTAHQNLQPYIVLNYIIKT